MSEFDDNWDFQLGFMKDVETILRRVAHKIIEIKIAPMEDDLKRCTDLIIVMDTGTVALRIRRNVPYRDITIRAKNGNAETEIHKLRNKPVRWYLYAWTKSERIVEWVLFDAHKFVDSGLIDSPRQIKMNKDGYTGFVAYSIQEIKDAGAVVHHAKK
jgi:hypothetical protein